MEVVWLAHGTHGGHSLEGTGEVEALENLQRAATSLLGGDSVSCKNSTLILLLHFNVHWPLAKSTVALVLCN